MMKYTLSHSAIQWIITKIKENKSQTDTISTRVDNLSKYRLENGMLVVTDKR